MLLPRFTLEVVAETTTVRNDDETQGSGQTIPSQIIELPLTQPKTPPPNQSASLHVNSTGTPVATNLAATITTWLTVCPPQRSPPCGLKSMNQMSSMDTCKLQPFLVQCNLNFRDCPDACSSDSAKVTFALSYLKGTMLDWFEPSLTSGESPPWLDDYSNFIAELKNNFGSHDPEGKAEAELGNLLMCDNQHIMTYLINFNHLAAHI